jgi:recombination protein RecR
MDYPESLQKLIHQFVQLPGIGPRTAERLGFFVVQQDTNWIEQFVEALRGVKAAVHYCPVCQNLTDQDPCPLCADAARDKSKICVVQESKDVTAIEKTRQYRGQYHVLQGVLSPMDGIGPEQLRIKELLARLADGTVTEIILATNPNVEGEATAMYLARLLKPMGLEVTRLAHGLPMGGDLEYADEATLSQAIAGRRPL